MKSSIQTYLTVYVAFIWIFSSNCEKSQSCRNFRRRHILKMACSDGGKIFLPRLMGFSNRNCGGCQGQSSDLLAQEHDCSWKTKCKVKLNRMHMITGCYAKINSVLIGERRCIQRGTEIYNLITKKTMKDSRIVHLPNTTFIVRSHRKFPWNYEYLSSYEKLEHHLNFSLQTKNIGQKMLISVIHFDIDPVKDNLYIMHKTRINVTNTSVNSFEFPLKDLSYFGVGFDVSLNHVYGAAKTNGFVMCLKLVNRDVQRVDSVCNDIISKDKLKFQLLKTSHRCTKKGNKGQKKCLKRKSKRKPN